MPAPYQPTRPYPGKRPYMLSEAAELGQLVVCRCVLCRRLVRYLASDLLALSGDRPAHDPPYDCSQCGKLEYVRVRLVLPEPGDYGHLSVRRPGPVRMVQTWRSVRLGD